MSDTQGAEQWQVENNSVTQRAHWTVLPQRLGPPLNSLTLKKTETQRG